MSDKAKSNAVLPEPTAQPAKNPPPPPGGGSWTWNDQAGEWVSNDQPAAADPATQE